MKVQRLRGRALQAQRKRCWLNNPLRHAKDSIKVGGRILAKSFALGSNGALTGLDFITQKPIRSARILTMIEQHIRDEIEPLAQQAEKDLIAIISIELGKLGINPDLAGTLAYTRGIADKYRQRLVGERIGALIDFMANIANQT